MLPATAATDTEMRTLRHNPTCSGGNHTLDTTVGIVAALFAYLNINDVAWRAIRYKNNDIVYPGYRIAFGGYAGNFYTLDQRVGFTFS